MHICCRKLLVDKSEFNSVRCATHRLVDKGPWKRLVVCLFCEAYLMPCFAQTTNLYFANTNAVFKSCLLCSERVNECVSCRGPHALAVCAREPIWSQNKNTSGSDQSTVKAKCFI